VLTYSITFTIFIFIVYLTATKANNSLISFLLLLFHSYKSQYDALITVHKNLFQNGIHHVDQFLPWHRWYILKYENLLRKIDCRFTVAYWDYVAHAGTPWATTSSDLWYSGTVYKISSYTVIQNGEQPRNTGEKNLLSTF